MRNYEGMPTTTTFVAGSNLTAGTGLQLAPGTFGVVVADVASGATGVLFRGPGRVQLPKAASITPANGARLYWDDTAKNVTSTAGSNTLIGCAVLPVAASGDATIWVHLNGVTS